MNDIYGLEEIMENSEEHIFLIDDDHKADWALRKIAEERKEADRIKAIAEQQIEELQMKIKHAEEVAERKTVFLKGCLAEYFQKVPHKATKTQESYKLLSGSLVFKLPKQNMVKDDEKLIEYFRSNGMEEFIKTKESPEWGEFKKQLQIIDRNVVDTATGDVIDAVKVEESAGIFDVKIG